MQSNTENSPANTQERILAAAEQEFLSKGYAGARTTTIAEAAGVTHAMLHYYYRTKKNLFDKFLTEKTNILHDLVASSFADINAPLLESLKQCINVHLDFVAKNPEMPRFLVTEVFGNPEHKALFAEKLKGIMPKALTNIQRKIDEGVDRGEFRYVDAQTLIIDLLALNVFSFLVRPLLETVMGPVMGDMDAFIAHRKKENFDTITRKLIL